MLLDAAKKFDAMTPDFKNVSYIFSAEGASETI